MRRSYHAVSDDAPWQPLGAVAEQCLYTHGNRCHDHAIGLRSPHSRSNDAHNREKNQEPRKSRAEGLDSIIPTMVSNYSVSRYHRNSHRLPPPQGAASAHVCPDTAQPMSTAETHSTCCRKSLKRGSLGWSIISGPPCSTTTPPSMNTTWSATSRANPIS